MSEPWRVLLELALALGAVPLLIPALYLALLTVAARRQAPPPAPQPPRWRFDVIIPAHNEASGIAQTISNLLALDYPAALRRVVVVADNCTDDTAAVARAAGAQVLTRQDLEHRGKGYALRHAFAHSLQEHTADAMVVVDADTVASPNLLTAFAARLEAGTSAVQAHYGVRNPEASWRTRLMTIALALFHRVRSLGRERLGLSCGLRGNGMCFRADLLREFPHDAFSIVEDLEYGLRLGRAGHRVAYANEAEVLGEMVSGGEASRSQRDRWEQGRAQMARLHGWSLLRDAVRTRSALLLDLAMDVLVPPLSRLVGLTILGLSLAIPLVWLMGVGAPALALLGTTMVCLALYVAAGWWHSGTGLRGLADLALAPAYLGWKLVLLLKRPAAAHRGEWVRTTREIERPS